jgi:enterochelin esterase-like enzyme
MNKNITLLFVFISLLVSCKSSKNVTLNESKYYTDSIYSNYLSEYRKHNIYLPKGFNLKNNYPIIYATDGNDIKGNNFIKKSLDSLINNNIIKPIIYIESHCNQKIADSTSTTLGDGRKVKLQFRNFEYVDSDSFTKNDKQLLNRFKNHKNYFSIELINYIEKNLKQKKSKKDRYFYGVSNGAGFGMSLLNSNSEIIGTYLCFSTFGGDIKTNIWKKDLIYPNLYLIYGKEEPEFLKDDAEFIKRVYQESNSFAFIKSFEGGHDYKIWEKELVNNLIKLFPLKK